MNQPLDLTKYDLVIFDADGTLRCCTVAGQPCPHRHGEWELIAGVKERLAQVAWHIPYKQIGTRFAIASNQAGIALKYMTHGSAFNLLYTMAFEAFGDVPPVDLIRICPHDPKAECTCRKPKPGMLLDILDITKMPNHRTLFVGDQESDEKAAWYARVDFVWACDFFRQNTGGVDRCLHQMTR